MPWVEVEFKGKTVWAEVGADGAIVSQGGRTPIRYSDKKGATIYRGGTRGISRASGSPVRDLPEGVSADDRKKGGKKASGFGSAGKRTAAQAAAAKADARSRIEALPQGTHLIFTDGACHGNPGPAGSAAVVKIAGGATLAASRALGIATNNVGELTAVGMALDLLEQGEVPNDAPIALFTDSKYTMGVLAQGWKAKANRELILEIRGRLKDWPNLEINWVAGHVGVPENERADALATLGAEQSK